MNAEIRSIKTAAEQGLATEFARARATLPGKGAIASLRDDAFKRFDANGLPHRRVEQWKYTDLRALMREALPLAASPDDTAISHGQRAGAVLDGYARCELLFVDGKFVPEHSKAEKEPGLTFRPMADALANDDPLVAQHFGKTFATDDAAVALNTALMSDGAVIKVAAGAQLTQPIHLVFSSGEKPSAAFARSLVLVEKGAKATIVEIHESGASQVNATTELIVGDDAQVDYFKITLNSEWNIASLLASVGARAAFNSFSFTKKSQMVRNQSFIRFAGERTHGGIRGVSLLRGKEHVDNTLVINHAVSNCDSRELFKTVLDDKSRGVFQGKIIVEPHAQKTDAKMMTRSLLLSDEAEASQKPELEIFADDVVCGHGATAGALDPGLKFYLMSRGISEKEAETLLIQAFIGEAIEEIAHEGIREALHAASRDWLGERG